MQERRKPLGMKNYVNIAPPAKQSYGASIYRPTSNPLWHIEAARLIGTRLSYLSRGYAKRYVPEASSTVTA